LKYLLFTLALLTSPALWAQSWDEIKSSSVWLWGEGRGATVKEADERAIADLISKISLQVESSFEQTDEEASENGETDSRQRVVAKVKTYSQATLSGTERMMIQNEPDAIVGRYVKRAEVSRIFEGRKDKIKELLDRATSAERDLRIDDALRYYYWAYALTQSLPHPNEAGYQDADGASHVAMAWIPEQMNRIFSGLKTEVVGRNEDDLMLRITYKGQAVSSVDYSYFDGTSWSNLYSAKDGRGVLELPQGFSPSAINMKYEYAYTDQALVDKEIESVLAVTRGAALRKSYTNVNPSGYASSSSEPTMSAPVSSSVETASASIANASSTAMNVTKQTEAIKRIIAAIRSRQYASVRNLFTTQGYEMFTQLINYGSARILGEPTYDFFPIRDGVMMRSLPMSFSFKQGVRKKFVEDVTFTFNAQGKVECVAFALGQKAEADILAHTNWSAATRLMLMEFLENYKTAYALKRLDYLNSIFDDDAVIIVGNVARKLQRAAGDGVNYVANNIIKRNRLTKNEYIRNLKLSFQSNEFINIRFSDNEVVKGRQDLEDYGIQIKQDYYSSHYGDSGYLFLKVDLNNPQEPIIRVRTWQPEPDPIDGLYSIYDF